MLLVTLSFIPLSSAMAGIRKNDIAKWHLINDNVLIDTKDFKVSKTNISFWIKEKNYNKRRLNIDCNNLTESEFYNGNQKPFSPILPKTIKYEIANNLCFLTEVDGFVRERRQPSWVKEIILRHENKKEKTKLSNEIEKKINESNVNILNDQINEPKIETNSKDNSKVNKNKKLKLKNPFRFFTNP